jgi:hypothetical protein
MSDIIPADWVLLEAAKRCAWPYYADARDGGIAELRRDYRSANPSGDRLLTRAFRALCDNIAKFEQPPVDRKELCAEEAWRLYDPDTSSIRSTSIRAIELWEEGFGA